MRLTEEQKRERIALAQDLEDVVTFFFYLVIIQSQFDYMGAISSAEAKEEFARRMHQTVAQHTEISDELRKQINDWVDDVTDTTTEHLIILNALARDADEKKRQTEEYYLSNDRARFLAEEESNTLFNGADFFKAVRLGYRTKTWHTMKDNRVRLTHERVDERTIPINELFLVGNSFMRFPRDWEYGKAREIAGCRCTISYSK